MVLDTKPETFQRLEEDDTCEFLLKKYLYIWFFCNGVTLISDVLYGGTSSLLEYAER